jgi:rubrerythrin
MMGISFNADEIFAMAVQVERNGAKFYRKAAKGISDKTAAQMLVELAAMEDDHEKTFADMREQLTDKQRELMVFDPDNEAAMYLRAMADGHVFDLKRDPSERLTGSESTEDIIRMGIGAEKNSIVFYLGLKDLVTAPSGKDRVDAIIKEEMSHISTLTQKLADLK